MDAPPVHLCNDCRKQQQEQELEAEEEADSTLIQTLSSEEEDGDDRPGCIRTDFLFTRKKLRPKLRYFTHYCKSQKKTESIRIKINEEDSDPDAVFVMADEFDLDEFAMFKVGGVVGVASVQAQTDGGEMDEEDEIIVLNDGSGQEDNPPAISAKLQSGKHQKVCIKQEKNEMTNDRCETSNEGDAELIIDLTQAPPLLSQELSETDRFDMVCAQSAETKEGEEKDLIEESEKDEPSQEKEKEKAMEVGDETENAHRENLEREKGGEKEITAAVSNEDNDNVIFVIDVIGSQELCEEDPVDFKKDEKLKNESEVEEVQVHVPSEGDNDDDTEAVQVPIEGENEDNTEAVQVPIEGENEDNTEAVQVPIEGENDDNTEAVQVPIEGDNDHKLVKDDDIFDFGISDSQLRELGSCEEDMEQLNSEGDKEACLSGQGVNLLELDISESQLNKLELSQPLPPPLPLSVPLPLSSLPPPPSSTSSLPPLLPPPPLPPSLLPPISPPASLTSLPQDHLSKSDASKQSCCHPIPSSSTSPCPSSSTTSSPFTSPVAKRPRVNACKILRSGTDLRKLYPINENPNGVIGWDLPGETQVFQVVLPEGPTQYTRNGWFAYDRGSIGLVCHNQLCKGSENQSIYVSHFKSKPPHSSLHLPAGSHSPSVSLGVSSVTQPVTTAVASVMPPSSTLPLQPVVATSPPPPASVASIMPPSSSSLPLQPVVATGPPSSPRDRTIYDEGTQRGPPPNNIVIEELGTDDEEASSPDSADLLVKSRCQENEDAEGRTAEATLALNHHKEQPLASRLASTINEERVFQIHGQLLDYHDDDRLSLATRLSAAVTEDRVTRILRQFYVTRAYHTYKEEGKKEETQMDVQ